MICARFLFLFFLYYFPFFSISQSSLSGVVVNENNTPLQRASVFVPNSTLGVYTDEKGNFTLNHLPAGNINFAVSYVGYETETVTVSEELRNKHYFVRLHPIDNTIKTVITSKQNNSWKKWIDVFTNNFVGGSSYAKHCSIENNNIVRFYYSEENKILRAFADEPLLVLNKDLGYEIKVSLVNFTYNTETNVVDYQVYSLFTEMDGTDKQKEEWKKNRKKVYSLSLLRFMRSAFADNFENDGYRVMQFEKKNDDEVGRIQKLYRNKYNQIKSAASGNITESDINAQLENSFNADSLNYYKRTLNVVSQSKGNTDKVTSRDTGFLKHTSKNISVLDFKGELKVTYTKIKEPEEYFEFKNEAPQYERIGTVTYQTNASRTYPATTLVLRQGIPLEINENGYYTNVDFFMDGFWGWWEKIATRLPYDYEP